MQLAFASSTVVLNLSALIGVRLLVYVFGFSVFSRNMVVAMKELSIRGDFRTTVEYLIKLLETESFRNNDIDTGWLDHLIAEKVQVRDWRHIWTIKLVHNSFNSQSHMFFLQAERPNTLLGVVCGALLVADAIFRKSMSDYLHSLERSVGTCR